MRTLEDRIVDLIRAHGPINIAQYMTLALTDRQSGYYRSRDPLGAAGDFTTAPEISQIFGELIGAALAQSWIDLKTPKEVLLVEAGPGRGTLMADATRATRSVCGFHESLELHLIEANTVLREKQAGLLENFRPRFHDDLESVPGGKPILLIANEFLDCLPIRQYCRAGKAWRERLVGLDDEGRLAFVDDVKSVHVAGAPDTDFWEASPAREAWIDGVASRISQQGGTAIIIDYGSLDHGHGNTFQAVRGHQRSAPLRMPGECDLTSHVIFEPLARCAKDQGCNVFGPVAQQIWLSRLGAAERYRVLASQSSTGIRQKLAHGLTRLLDPKAMGQLFQVMAISTLPEVPGFTSQDRFL